MTRTARKSETWSGRPAGGRWFTWCFWWLRSGRERERHHRRASVRACFRRCTAARGVGWPPGWLAAGAPPRPARHMATTRPRRSARHQTLPRDSLAACDAIWLVCVYGTDRRGSRAVFTSKISLSKLHYSSITSNFLPHVWSIKYR